MFFRKMDDYPVYTTPDHHPPEMDVLPKTFLQIIIAANGLEAFNNVTQTAATTFAFSSACFFFYDPDIIPS